MKKIIILVLFLLSQTAYAFPTPQLVPHKYIEALCDNKKAYACYTMTGDIDEIFISDGIPPNLFATVVLHEYGHYFMRRNDNIHKKVSLEREEDLANMFAYWVQGLPYAEKYYGDYFRSIIR